MMKVLEAHGCKIEFEKLDYGRMVSNIMRFYIDGRYNGAIYPTQKFGNWWYIFLRNNPERMCEAEFNRIFLRWAIYCDNYAEYSDLTKDIFGHRIKKTKTEFEQMYKEERAIYEH